MAWIRSKKKSSGGNTLWILNPTENSDLLSGYSGKTLGSYVPYICKINTNPMQGYPDMATSTTFNGTTEPVIYRGGYQVGGVIFPVKVPKDTYSTLYFECRVQPASSGSYRNAYVEIAQNLTDLTSYGQVSNPLKSVMLVAYDHTSAEINSQTGVVIDSTSPTALSDQTVEIDISGLTDDFYVAFWNCDTEIYIRSIYLE